MSTSDTTGLPERHVTIDELRQRVEVVKSMAVDEAKEAVDTIVDENATRTLLVVAGLVVVAASLAFYLGSRAVRR